VGIDETAADFSRKIKQIYRDRLLQVIHYGSTARGDGGTHSDIDILVVLDGLVQPGREIDRMIDVITDINLETGELLSILPVSGKDYAEQQSPLFINIRREGIAV
jgi:predicted nucleotidyltransferase